ncbi:hypothetical protein BU14_0427s0024 [Porphyra umbilicalis]|uniref:Uncharacterized protein n=1 Tax=Porphyra umbilicalis TaxID=2786 RepID=A0A1X6NV75_PORUM|nr:hypothetical protein BU14_0427s0024 [Porphyra umbilicalis]|eukprot:OSX72534.1 hypothetical protein BU14_0427s0024 [Porphyra umbilicalis]
MERADDPMAAAESEVAGASVRASNNAENTGSRGMEGVVVPGDADHAPMLTAAEENSSYPASGTAVIESSLQRSAVGDSGRGINGRARIFLPVSGAGNTACSAQETMGAEPGLSRAPEDDGSPPDGAFFCEPGMPLVLPDDLVNALARRIERLAADPPERTTSNRSRRQRRRRRRTPSAPVPQRALDCSSSSSSCGGVVPLDLFGTARTSNSSSEGARSVGGAGAHDALGGAGGGMEDVIPDFGDPALGPGAHADHVVGNESSAASVLSGTATAIQKYSDAMVAALDEAILDGGGPTSGGGNVPVSPAYRVEAVAGGAAVVFTENDKGHVAWMRRVRDTTIFLCSCGGRKGAESTEMRAFAGVSSTCVHGYALKDAASALLRVTALSSVELLLDEYPVLDAARTTSEDALDVHYGTKTPKRMGVFAVLEANQWVAVTIRRRMIKGKAKKRMGLRASCSHLACTSGWTCVHANAVNDWCLQARTAAAAADGVGGQFHLQDADVQLSTFVRRTSGGPLPPGRGANDARYSDESRWRNVRNMLPCSGEIADCLVFDELADVGRGGPPPLFQEGLREGRCFKCKGDYDGHSLTTTAATMHTLRGRISVRLEEWVCSCGEPVPYDGAQDALFASSKKTVFTRTFIDVLSQMVFTGHSTLSSAAGVFSFLLEVSDSLPHGRQSLSRQLLTTAVHRYTRTLLVPAALFRCLRCYKSPQRPYPVVVSDGEAISVQRNQSEPLERVDADVPVTRLDTDVGSCVTVPALRALIRKRARAKCEEATRLTAREALLIPGFAAATVADPEPHDPDNIVARPANVLWAASYIFFSFCSVQSVSAGASHAPAADGSGSPPSQMPPGPSANAPHGNEAPGNAPPGAEAANDDGDAEGDGVLGDDGGVGGADASDDAPGGFVASHPQECHFLEGAVGTSGSSRVLTERWSVVRHFLQTFLAEPVLGAFAGLDRAGIRKLAEKLVTLSLVAEWRACAMAVESVHIVWPFLRLVAEGDDVDSLLLRAVGELLLFTSGVDAYWETAWRAAASDAVLSFEEQWKVTSIEQYKTWEITNRGDMAAIETFLSSTSRSCSRVTSQAVEARTGSVWPDLEPVRPFMRDSKSDAVNALRAERLRNDAAALEREMARQLGSDECRHNFITSEVFMPGIENFLCPCGVLIGYDFLDKAESPAHVLGSLVQRMPLLPKVIYFDTACQLSRNAFRRVPWLMNRSDTATSVDRHHNQGDQHGCSDCFNADKYPGRSVHHRTSCAESRHSLNKAFKSHLAHLRQDHFIVQMRLLAAVINLRVKMRQELGKETNHRLLCTFFHNRVATHCERRVCFCSKWIVDDEDKDLAASEDGSIDSSATGTGEQPVRTVGAHAGHVGLAGHQDNDVHVEGGVDGVLGHSGDAIIGDGAGVGDHPFAAGFDGVGVVRGNADSKSDSDSDADEDSDICSGEESGSRNGSVRGDASGDESMEL